VNDGKLTDINPQNFTSDKQRDLYDYWLKIKKDHLMPSRKDFNPVDIPHILSSIWMADVIPGDEPTFSIRLLGTDVVEAFGVEATKQPLHEVEFSAGIVQRFRELIKVKQPYYYQGRFPVESEDYKYYSSITLPMSGDDEHVDIILSSVHCFN